MATKVLERTLLKDSGAPRVSVLVVLWNDSTNSKQLVATTKWAGKFSFDITTIPTGIYHLEYYGDGIDPTVFDEAGTKLSEDDVTPWIYGISIVNEGTIHDITPPKDSVVQSAGLET